MPYTSGTTGRPKGVRRGPMAEEARQRMMAVTCAAYGVEPGMRGLLSAPLYHSAPNVYALSSMLVAELLVLEPAFRCGAHARPGRASSR
jgi:long-chain acyl-CoA synthetase